MILESQTHVTSIEAKNLKKAYGLLKFSCKLI